MEGKIIGKKIQYGKQNWEVCNGQWSVWMFGSHGPNDPPVGLSWKKVPISSDRVPDAVKKLA